MKTDKFELQALRLRKHLKDKGIDLTDEDSIDTIAVLNGFYNWFAMKSNLETKSSK